MNIWTSIDRMLGCVDSRDLQATLRARLAFAFSAMLGIMTAVNSSLLTLAGDARPGMIALGFSACFVSFGAGAVGILLRRPAITMYLVAIFAFLIYGLGVVGNRGAIPPSAAYLPCVLLGFYQFWGPRMLWVALPAVTAFFAAVFMYASGYDQPVAYPFNALGFAFGFACIWLICLAAVFGSVQQMAKSQLQSANVELSNALNDSRAAQRAKSEFLANVGHEVRTPLNGVLGMADVMHRVGGLAPDQAERLDLIRESGTTLLELLNEILDQSKIETGQVIAEEVDFDLSKLAEKTAASWRPEAEKQSLDLVLDLSGLQQAELRGDPLRLRQILNNLISNAVKFTARGCITLAVNQTALDDGRWMTRLEVSDTGAGIPSDRLDTVFEPFHQADASITRRYGGTGLGLSISRQLAELMGGDLQARSTVGEGSAFTVSLPLAEGSPIPADTPEKDDRALDLSAPVRILSVDDVPTNHVVLRALLEQVLAGAELTIDCASSGGEAIAMAKAAVYDLIFMDIQMPDMDGITATQQIRNTSADRPVWVISVSAIEASESARLLPLGLFDGKLSKPASLLSLQSALLDWQSGRDQTAIKAIQSA